MSLRPLAAVTAVAALALSGCGVSDAGIRPGQAASIDGQAITVAEVDEVAASACAVLRSDPRFEGQALSGTTIRGAAHRGLVLEAMSDRLVEEYDVVLPASASDGAEAYRSSYGGADPADVDTAEPVFTADQRFTNVLIAIGTERAGEGAADEAVIAAGVEEVQAWQESADISTNPAFAAIEVGDQQILSTRDDLSVATSDFAVEAAAAETSEGFAATLPESQRCG